MDQIRIAFTGKAGAGKDYAARYIADKMPTLRAAYADELKRDMFYLLVDPLANHARDQGSSYPVAWVNDRKDDPWMRSLLQAYGEAMVALEGETYWAERCKHVAYGHALFAGQVPAAFESSAIVITDCRKLPEAEHARADGFVIVRILRTDGYQAAGITPENSQHRSETEQEQIKADFTIFNNGTQDFDWYLGQLIQWVANGITVVPNGVPA